MKYPFSDHYDGRRFFNPNQTQAPGFWKTVKMLASLRYKRWPDSAQNAPILNLNTILGSDQIAITFVNHATVLIQLPGLNILTDPVWSKRASPLRWAGPKRVRAPGIDFDSLPRIDLVFISHNHYDHMDLAVQAHADLESRQSIGIHFGTFQLTEEEMDAPARELGTALAQAHLDPKSFVTLSEGVTTIYSLG